MPDFESTGDDALEQEQSATDAEAAVERAGATEVGVETPEADAQEQRQPLHGDDAPYRPTVPVEANEADAAEQAREVELDEDEYR